MTERCEWDPEREQPATVGGNGCMAEATVSVGKLENWHLCASCAALPRFKRMTHRSPLTPSPTQATKAPAGVATR